MSFVVALAHDNDNSRSWNRHKQLTEHCNAAGVRRSANCVESHRETCCHVRSAFNEQDRTIASTSVVCERESTGCAVCPFLFATLKSTIDANEFACRVTLWKCPSVVRATETNSQPTQ